MEQNEFNSPGYEHTKLKGITIKNMIVTVVCTATMVATVMSTYFNLMDKITEQRYQQEKEAIINDARLKAIEIHLTTLDQQIAGLQKSK